MDKDNMQAITSFMLGNTWSALVNIINKWESTHHNCNEVMNDIKILEHELRAMIEKYYYGIKPELHS